MHELKASEEILSAILKQAEAHKARRVRSVCLRVGALSGVAPSSIEFFLDLLSRGTVAEGARLEVTEVEAKARCEQCQVTFAVDGLAPLCPNCGRIAKLICGGELSLESIEIE